MSAQKFTPGPWYPTNHFADDTTPCNCAYVLSDGYAGSICTVSFDNGLSIADGGNDSPAKDEAAANANLIAASPDLYDQLTFAVKLLDNLPGFRGTAQLDRMQAALAKARGE